MKMTVRATGQAPPETLINFDSCHMGDKFPMADSNHLYMPLCAICGKACDLETCKSDWNGKAVHEECLIAQLASRKISDPPANLKPS
jgi:hypothetical protein